MKCSGCGFDAPPDFAFCPRCGRKLVSACPACGFAHAPDFAFCPRCGARLGTAEPPGPASVEGEEAGEADRRPVTVLFADLSGFTALSERLDPEEIRAFQHDLFRQMAEAVERYDGFIEKFVGDAVMAVFGAPVAHEDDPERALRAALAMREGLRALNHRWERRFGTPLSLHVGVNTGPVVAGNIGSAAGGAYAVTGDTVNTAARLQAAAPPGEILVSRATFRLTRPAFAFEPAGELALRGKAEAVPVHRLLVALGAPRSARGLEGHGLAAPLIGREDELGQMLAAFDRTLRGRAQVLSLMGEAGAGKSRLIREFFARLKADGRLEGTTVRRAVCSSLGEPTYGVLAAFVREAFDLAPDDSLETAREKLQSGVEGLGAEEADAARLGRILGYVLGFESGEAVRHVGPEQLKRQIFMAFRALFERRLREGPCLLVVEDLHWADAASIELLRFMLDRLAERQLMLLLAYRPTFDAGTMVTSRATHTALRLAPLSAAEGQALLEALFGLSAGRLPPGLGRLIIGRAEGNPLYLEEVVRSLIEGGVLVREGSGWRCPDDVASVNVPPTIQGLLLSRLDHLPPEARRLIQEAAVLGPVFDRKLLRMVSSEPEACDAALETLLDAELLKEVSADGQYRFAHALAQEVIYQNLLVRRRTELHGRVGRVLEALYGERPGRLEEVEALGRHFGLSEDKPRGARYLLAAGDWARAVYANDDAVRHYERALRTLQECGSPEGETLAVRERLGDLLGPMGRREAALEHYEAVRAAHAAAGDRPAQARLDRKLGGLHWDGGNRERALACYRAGLALLEGHAGEIELAHLYREMGRLAFRSGDNQRAIEWAERALAQAERVAAGGAPVGTPAAREGAREAAVAISHANNTLGVALARTGRLAEAVARIEESVAVAQAHELLQAACRGYTNLGVVYSTLDPGRAIRTCQEGLETAKKIGDLGFQSRLYANLAVAYCALTDRCSDEGIAAAQTAIDLDRQLGQLDHLTVPLIVLGQIHQCHGNPERAVTYYREALELAEPTGEPQLVFPCYDGLATLSLDRGDEATAEHYMRKAQEVCDRAGVEPDSLVVLPFLD